MIASGLKKLANENGMKVAHGVAYGSLRGYTATLSEGSGYKQIVFSTRVADADALLAAINQVDVQRTYRVQSLNVAPRGIQIVFMDNPGTMKKIESFIDWFIPLLGQHGATMANVCTECGGDATNGRWILIDGVAHYLHDSCAEKVRREITETEESEKQNRDGTYGGGAVGAFIGAALGAVVWTLVLMMGYVASIVGLLIGWLSEKGYNLTKGKQGKGKIVILILAIIFGVVLGTFAADVVSVIQFINNGEIVDLTAGEAPLLVLMTFIADAEYRTATLLNVGMGLLFAGLGVYTLLRKTGKAVSGTKIIDLE
jgi:hypothetical protein